LNITCLARSFGRKGHIICQALSNFYDAQKKFRTNKGVRCASKMRTLNLQISQQ
jgi:hypothetical protein